MFLEISQNSQEFSLFFNEVDTVDTLIRFLFPNLIWKIYSCLWYIHYIWHVGKGARLFLGFSRDNSFICRCFYFEIFWLLKIPSGLRTHIERKSFKRHDRKSLHYIPGSIKINIKELTKTNVTSHSELQFNFHWMKNKSFQNKTEIIQKNESRKTIIFDTELEMPN